MYDCVVAEKLEQASEKNNSTNLLPTPQMLSHIVCVLKAEVVLLYESISH
jgi:hypothetical protein